MKIKELTTIGFKPTPKKDYYYYIQDHFYLLLQVLPHHKIALLLTTEDSKHQRDILEQLFIKRDDVERIYSNEKGAGLVLSKRIKKEELENIILTLKKEINQSPQCHHCHQSKPLNVYLLDDEIRTKQVLHEMEQQFIEDEKAEIDKLQEETEDLGEQG